MSYMKIKFMSNKGGVAVGLSSMKFAIMCLAVLKQYPSVNSLLASLQTIRNFYNIKSSVVRFIFLLLRSRFNSWKHFSCLKKK